MTNLSVCGHDGPDVGIATVFLIDREAVVGALAFTNSQDDEETCGGPDVTPDTGRR